MAGGMRGGVASMAEGVGGFVHGRGASVVGWGMHGRGCVAGGRVWRGRGAWQILRDTVNERAVRILLECILVKR